ncbi:MAG: NAD(P)-binding domain-containing protein [Planctomycetota bacterium]
MKNGCHEARYCIIGAGYSGLGVAKAFRDAGIPFDCFEKNDAIGGNWYDGVYDSTHIISSRDTTGYGDFPMPRSYPDFPSRKQVLDYLNAYADRFDLHRSIQLRTEVSHMEPVDPKGMEGWRLRLADGTEHHYSGVVVANGHHWAKRIPSYPGHFSCKTLHSKDYKNPSDFAGKRVLVVGAGNSGCDIAVEAAKTMGEAHISMRRGYYFLPKTIMGIPTAEMDHPWVPFFVQKGIIRLAIWISVGSNERYGLQKPDHKLFEHHPIVNSQLLYFIRHGSIQPHRDIARLDGQTVHFVDGTSIDVDTIVWATGFHVSFPFLDHALFEWENGIPKRLAGMLAPNLAGLYVFGLLQPRGGAGPLISAGAQFLADIVSAQECLDVPIADELSRFMKPDANMLVGVHSTLRQIRFGRRLVRWIAKRGSKRTGRSKTSQSSQHPSLTKP